MKFIRKVIAKLVSILSPEAWGYILFIAGAAVADSYKKFLLVMAMFVGLIWVIRKNIRESLWLSYLSIFMVDRTIDTVVPYPLLPTVFNGLIKGNLEWSFSINMAEILLAMLVIVLVFERINKKTTKFVSEIDWRLILMVVLGGIATIKWGGFYDYPWYGLVVWSKYLVVYAVARLMWFGGDGFKKVMLEILGIWCMANVLLMGWQSIKQSNVGVAIEDNYMFGRFADEDPLLFRPGGMSWNANLTAGILLMALPLLMVGTWKRLLNARVGAVMSMGCLLGIILSSSRFVWLMLPLVLAVMWKWWKVMIEHWRFTFAANRYARVVSLIIILGGMLVMAPRLLSLLNTTGYEYRWNHFELTLKEIMARPWGLGPDMYRFRLASSYEPSEYSYVPSPQHNIFLEVATGFGLLGVGLFGWWLWDQIKIVFRSKFLSESARVLWLASVIFLMLGQVYSMLFSATITQLWWIAMGFLYAEVDKKINR